MVRPLPLGYRLVEVEKRGAKIKRKLEFDLVEAETVRLIFDLYLSGDGTSSAQFGNVPAPDPFAPRFQSPPAGAPAHWLSRSTVFQLPHRSGISLPYARAQCL